MPIHALPPSSKPTHPVCEFMKPGNKKFNNLPSLPSVSEDPHPQRLPDAVDVVIEEEQAEYEATAPRKAESEKWAWVEEGEPYSSEESEPREN